jgi:polyribonucleotide nucleotidyltransferase
MIHRIEGELGGKPLTLETGRVAKQAHGAVWIQYGETVILATAVRSNTPEDRGFLPLTVDYREKAYAGGKIPGNFFKREGRPSESEILNCRQIDHPIRPMFPKNFPYEVQVFISVLSFDGENSADAIALLGASAALCISDIPFAGAMGAVRVGRIDGQMVVNPTFAQLDESDMDIVVSGPGDSIVRVEGGAHEISESDLLEALKFGQEKIKILIDLQDQLVKLAGQEKIVLDEVEKDLEIEAAVATIAVEKVTAANQLGDMEARGQALDALATSVKEDLAEKFPERNGEIGDILEGLVKKDMRRMILEEKKRIDGRSLTEVRQVTCETAVLPRVHGSSIFTRGQTQALCVASLGNKYDERMKDDLSGKSYKSFYLDYNFPSYSVGEVRRISGPGRREIGHGHLAERALEPVIPSDETFPYTIRLVSEITESNSSSSMASVCGSSLALMDAGIPIRTAVCGAGVGLVMEGEEWELLTDIQGAEDFLGDMDLKVAGTEDGITAIQMDIKIQGIRFDIMEDALERAFEGRLHILQIMNKSLSASREELSPYAPRIEFTKIEPDKIGTLIGPGGKMIREIEKQSGANVTVESDDGTVVITAPHAESVEIAKKIIETLTGDPEVGELYEGTVKRIMPFGAFVEIIPGKEGLLHISELAHRRVEKVEDVVSDGQKIAVKVLEIDNSGKIRLSHKATLEKDS